MRLMAAAAAVLVLASIADVVTCTALRHTLNGRFKHWAQDVRAQGYTLTYGTLRSDSFLWGARLIVPGLSLSGGRAVLPGGVDWHAERVVLSLTLLSPTWLTVEPEGEQTLRAAGAEAIAFFAENFNAEVPLTDERLDRIDIEAQGLAGGPRHPGHMQDVRIGSLRATLQADRAGASRTTARLSLSARQIGLPDDGHWALGATISQLDADISLASPALSGESPAEQARAWHDWGGLLTVEALSLHWGPLGVRAVAELGLDDRLQPAGTGTARVLGAEAALDALARSFILSPGVAQTAKVVLALMPVQADDGGQTRVLPFTLRDNTLSVGKTPLVHVGDITWGE
jgi:hypothetical protein